MISLNEFLIHKTDTERSQWLQSYLREIAKLHQNRQAATLKIEVNNPSGHNLDVVSNPNISLVDNKSCIANLTDCLAQLYPRYDRYLPQIWNQDPFLKDYSSLKNVEKLVYKKRKDREKSLESCFENNDRFQVSKSWNHFQVIQKELDSPELNELLLAPDQAISNGEILKDCKATTVSLYQMANGQKVIIKRYNSKGTAYSLTRSLIDSRAKVCWRGALLLDQIGIGTPKNLAMLEIRQGPWIKTSYLITEFIDGKDLSTFFLGKENFSQWYSVVQQTNDILVTLPQVRIAHGDFKSTNFLILNDQPLLIDLDSFKIHKIQFIYKSTYLRDIDRFERNWIDTPNAKIKFQPIIDNIRKHI